MAEEPCKEADALLDVHVINAGIGESVLIRMPGERWGVVDCYCRSVKDSNSNPTVRFLKDRKVSRLEFLCLTHPHDDHYRGMSQLLELFQPRYFWRSACVTPEQLKRIVLHLDSEARQRADPSAMETAKDLAKTFGLVRQMKKNGLQVIHLSDIQPAYPIPHSLDSSVPLLKIIGIAPSANLIERYEDSLNKCFTSAGALMPEAPSLKHNEISIALLVQYGSTTIVLGGDVESDSWLATTSLLNTGDLASQGVKVSHHGSPTGYTPDLWGYFGRTGSTHAVIAPSRRHQLPKQEAVEHILAHVQHVFTTCKTAMPSSRGFGGAAWESYSPQVQSALKKELSDLRSLGPGDLGICSLTFDSNGNCREILLSGNAAEVTGGTA